MSFLKEVKQSNRRIWWRAGIAAAVLAVVGTAGYFLWKSDLFYKKINTDAKEFTVNTEMNQLIQESDLQTGYMTSRMKQVLMENRGMDPFMLSWVVVPGTTRSVPGYQSEYVDTFEQVLLLENYVLSGKKSNAETLMKAIEENLVSEDGRLMNYAKADSLGVDTSSASATYDPNNDYEETAYPLMQAPTVSMQATTTYLRVLLDYYDKWGSQKLLQRIEELAERVFEAESVTAYRETDGKVRPTPMPVSEIVTVTPTPTPKEEQPVEKLVGQQGLELSAMDLDALRRVSEMWPKYKEKYETILTRVKGGRLSESLPLYAWVCGNDGNYTYYAGSQGDMELIPSLYTMVHLAEVGELDKESYAWISSKIYNAGMLYTKYNLFSGDAVGSEEAVEAYPLVLRLAVINGDSGLFAATYKILMKDYSTLDTSQVLYTFYRNVPEQRIALYARENLLLLLYLR